MSNNKNDPSASNGLAFSMKDVAEKALAIKREADDMERNRAKLLDDLTAYRKEKKRALDKQFVVRESLRKEKEDQNDIYFFLHKKLDDNYDIISELENQLLSEGKKRFHQSKTKTNEYIMIF